MTMISTYHTNEIQSKKSRGKYKTEPVSVLDLKNYQATIGEDTED
jgi:hypothetical protein